MTNPSGAKTWVCDWTRWQGKPLPAKGVADEGFGMVKLKVGGAAKDNVWYHEDPLFFASAVPLLGEPRLIPGAFWYLVPGRASAQAALCYDMLDMFGVRSWCVFLDVEQPGVTWRDVERFLDSWNALTGEQKLAIYTRRNFWESIGAPPGAGSWFPFLEEAHWVSGTVRMDSTKPYASQQAKAIDPAWWDVNYGGWKTASMLQFTDNALVQGVRTSASVYRGTADELKGAFLG